MKHKHLLSLLQKNYVTVGVQFPESPGKTYTYKSDIKDLKVDDQVITKTGLRFGIAKVVRVDKTAQIDLDANYEYKWLVQKVDAEGYEARIKDEQEIVEQLDGIEREHQKQVLVEKMMDHLPSDSPLRKQFDAIMQRAAGTALSAPTPTVDKDVSAA